MRSYLHMIFSNAGLQLAWFHVSQPFPWGSPHLLLVKLDTKVRLANLECCTHRGLLTKLTIPICVIKTLPSNRSKSNGLLCTTGTSTSAEFQVSMRTFTVPYPMTLAHFTAYSGHSDAPLLPNRVKSHTYNSPRTPRVEEYYAWYFIGMDSFIRRGDGCNLIPVLVSWAVPSHMSCNPNWVFDNASGHRSFLYKWNHVSTVQLVKYFLEKICKIRNYWACLQP